MQNQIDQIMKPYIPEIETKPVNEIEKLQEKKLAETLSYLSVNSKYYKDLFVKNKIDIRKIKTIKDLEFIPVTVKEDLCLHNDDFICVPNNKIIDYITTSGTLGDPVTFVMTDADLDRLAYNEYLSFACAGATSDDVFQLMTTIDKRFMAGLAYFLGARKMGAGIIRVGNGVLEMQWDSIKRFSSTALITVPSFILKVIEYAETNNIDFKSSSIKKALCIGEPLRNPDLSSTLLAEKILSKWDIDLYSTYASTEMATAFTECSCKQGNHHHPELIIVEFLDDNNLPVQPGEAGEVTITTLGVEGMPLLRYKTGDICFHYTEPCACGRNTMRLGSIIGRKNQMLKYKGTTLFPQAIFDVLDHLSGIHNYVVEVTTNSIGTDDIKVIIGTDFPSGEFENTIKNSFKSKLRVTPTIVFDSINKIKTIQGVEVNRKPIKFIDNRKRT